MRRFILLVVVSTFTVAIFGPIMRGRKQPPNQDEAAAKPVRVAGDQERAGHYVIGVNVPPD